MTTYWLLSASERLRAALHGHEADANLWVAQINNELVRAFPDQVVLVRDYFQGYREFYGMVILLVEVQPLGDKPSGRFRSPGTYIVKVAFGELVKALKGEIDAWNHSRPQHVPFDNVFVALEAHPDEHNPTLLVYADANVVLGQRNIITLEDAFTQSCRFGVPIPESIDRVLASLYQRMNQSFFQHSHLEAPTKYLSSHRPNLQELLDRYAENVAASGDPDHAYDLHRRRHRRETLALLASEHEHYADPVDLLAGMKLSQIGPEVLRGTAHGDLHGRNVQVSMVKDEVSQCAVYDYEKFSGTNLLAWDFIKLEIETAVRMLDRFGDFDMARFTRQCLVFWRHVAARTAAFDRKATLAIPAELELPSIEWNRLADRLVRIRILAYENLGESCGRVYEWLDEYEFLLTWYACRAALYSNYHQRWSVAAIVAAGVAARRLMRRLPAEIELSHRRRFVEAKELARSSQTDQMEQGEKQLRELSEQYPHVLEVREEHVLVLIKLDRSTEAESILTAVAESYDHTTAETPSRWGALWKRRAYKSSPPDEHALERALTWYQRAVEQEPDNYYPRINVATLLLIRGQHARSQAEASLTIKKLDLCSQRDHWWLATKGEAMLLMGQDIAGALGFYQRAVTDRGCQPQDRKSMHDQLLFLRPHWPAEIQTQLTDATLCELFMTSQDGSWRDR